MNSRTRGLYAIAAATAITIVALFPAVATARLQLSGRVLTQGGSPIEKASVYIYTAAPRVGTSVYCPSCYPDCGKTRTTGNDGRFVVPALSDSLLFQVLVIAPGFEPTFAKKVDPSTGPLEVRLDARDPKRIEPARAVVGRVVDPEGKPVVGATLTPEGFHEGDGGTFGYYPGTDPLAITDEMGSFAMMTAQPKGSWDLRVRARDLSPTAVQEAPTGGPSLTIVMQRGATVTGRVLRAGQVLPGVVVGLDQVMKRSGTMTFGREEIATDDQGRFTVFNVTPGQDYWVFGTLESFRPYGVANSTRITVGEADSLVVVPTLDVGPAHRIVGRVRLTDGQPLPPGTRVTIAREPLGGNATVLVDADGHWQTGGIPNETVQVMTRVPGYRLAHNTPGYIDRFTRKLVVNRDRDDVEIVLEPE